MTNAEVGIQSREDAVRQAFEQAQAQHASELAKVVADARSEFENQRAQLMQVQNQATEQLRTVVEAVQLELAQFQSRIDTQSGGSGGRGNPKFGKSFLPLQELKPPKLQKEEQRREWSEHFA